ncbi:hypothetical protein [Aquimonas voraii]|uniref:Uncharacterized protein n=1 Tax=Aquimonas voraii TaxID=265719 RepID=A0A1G6S3Q7_9GAMM|nr:hypothetical protein [Aquimonas voraii]SDD11331.1 hypothetical protein SAMN04488509_101280 [Aquimonas voraii]
MPRFFVLLLILTLPASALAAGARIQLLQAAAAPGQGFDLRIEDSWPNACTPQLETIEVAGLDVWVTARDASEGQFCGQALTQYSLDTRLLATAREGLQEVGLQRVHFVVRSSAGLRLRGFELIAMGGEVALAPELESGYWWADPAAQSPWAGRGIGLNLERQSGTLSGVLYGYDASGQPEWSLGAGMIGPHFTRLSLSRLSDGSGPAQPFREPRSVQSIGSMLIEPVSPSKARLWLAYQEPQTGDLSLRQIELVRFGFDASLARVWGRGEWLLLPPADEQGRSSARQLVFSEVEIDASGFILLDPEQGAALACRVGGGKAEQIPELCELSIVSGEEAIAHSFDRIGLRRMQGTDAEGRRVRLIHLDAN